MPEVRSLAEGLVKSAAGNQGIRLIAGDRDEVFVPYRELRQQALRWLAGLNAAGCGRGDEVVLQIEAHLPFLTLFWACILGGMIPVPLAPGNRPDHRQRLWNVWPLLRRPWLAADGALLDKLRGWAAIERSALAAELPRRSFAWEELEPPPGAPGTAAIPPDPRRGVPAPISAGALAPIPPVDPPPILPEDLAYLQFSSGSTGEPKGVELSHRNLLTNTGDLFRALGGGPDDALLGWMPLTHDMGLVGMHLMSLLAGVTHTLMPTQLFIRRPALWLKKASEHRATILCSPNFGYHYFLSSFKPEMAAGWDLSRVRVCNGGEPISAALAERFVATLAPWGLRDGSVFPSYGLAEACVCVTTTPPWEPLRVHRLDRRSLELGGLAAAAESAGDEVTLVDLGFPLDHCEVRIAGGPVAGEEVLGEGIVGHVEIRGENVTRGYYGNPEATRQARAEGGWLRTGDLGFLRAGRLVVTGRTKDMLIVGGFNHYLHDLERLAEEVEGLEPGRVAACGLPRPEGGGEALVLCIYWKAPLADFAAVAERVREHLMQRLGLAVEAVVPVRRIPKTTSGKIQRFQLARDYAGGAFAAILRELAASRKASTAAQTTGGHAAPGAPTYATATAAATAGERALLPHVLGAAAKILGAAVDSDRPLGEQGFDSQKAVALAAALSTVFGVTLPVSLAFDYPTARQIARFAAAQTSAAAQAAAQTPEVAGAPAAPPRRADPAAGEPIAIIGLGCRFPGGADGADGLWRVLHEGIDTVTAIPPERWDAASHYDPDPEADGKMTTRQGSFLAGIDLFDHAFFAISEPEAEALDPQQRLLLEVAWEALEHAGQDVDSLHGSATGVFLGLCGADYAAKQVRSGDLARIGPYSLTGNAASTAAGRLSYVFGFEGPCVALDTACSSSLVAVHLAAQSLRGGESSLAIAGGVNLILTPEIHVGFSRLRAMAPDGRCKTFDRAADGYGRGEGCGIVVLKRLADALAAGDRILALLRGSAINQDGATNGLTAPSGAAQQKVIRQALERAGVAPAAVGYVEAHGTGTPLGDPQEMRALAAVYGTDRPAGEPLRVGSIKTNLAHTEAAAGVAGLLKAVLALMHEEIPPALHLRDPSPHIPWAEIPCAVPVAPVPWRRGERPRLAGVSAFGFSGTNAHAVIEEAPAAAPPLPPGEWEGEIDPAREVRQIQESRGARRVHLLPISARDPAALLALLASYRRLLATESDAAGGLHDPTGLGGASDLLDPHALQGPHTLQDPDGVRGPGSVQGCAAAHVATDLKDVNVLNDLGDLNGTHRLHDLCATAALRRSHHAYRVALVGASHRELLARLDEAVADGLPAGTGGAGRAASADRRAPGAVFVFPGQGSQWDGMARHLLRREPVFRATMEEVEAACARHVEWRLIAELEGDGCAAFLDRIDRVQPALFAVQVALAALWRSWGIHPAAVVGHSMGEVAAAHVAGALALDDAARIICRRSRLLQRASGHGAMASVELTLEEARRALDGREHRISVAASNGPRSTVLAGDPEGVDEVLAELALRSVFGRRIRVDVASHSHQMDPLQEDLQRELAGIAPRRAGIPLLSTVTGRLSNGLDLDTGYWVANLRQPVLFAPAVAALLAGEHRYFIELSPHPILLPAVEQCIEHAGLEGRAHAVASLRRERPEQEEMLGNLALLYARGYPVAWEHIYGKPGRPVDLPSYPWQRRRLWLADPPAGTSRGGAAGAAGAAGSHPLLGPSFAVAAERVHLWETDLDPRRLPYLDDHRVGDAVLFPAAGWIEMVAAATRQIHGRPWDLEEVELVAALALPAHPAGIARRIQLRIEDGPPAVFAIHSAPASGAGAIDWQLHVRGTLQPPSGAAGVAAATAEAATAAGAATAPTAGAAAATPERRISGAEHYRDLAERGLHYGRRFQRVAEVWAAETSARARIVADPALAAAPGYEIHPTLLDACLQTFAAAAGGLPGLYLPVAVRRLSHLGPAGSELLAAATWHRTGASPTAATAGTVTARGGDGLEGDLTVTGPRGEPVLHAAGIRLERLRDVDGATADPAGLLHEIAWLPVPSAANGSPSARPDAPAPTSVAFSAPAFAESGPPTLLGDPARTPTAPAGTPAPTIAPVIVFAGIDAASRQAVRRLSASSASGAGGDPPRLVFAATPSGAAARAGAGDVPGEPAQPDNPDGAVAASPIVAADPGWPPAGSTQLDAESAADFARLFRGLPASTLLYLWGLDGPDEPDPERVTADLLRLTRLVQGLAQAEPARPHRLILVTRAATAATAATTTTTATTAGAAVLPGQAALWGFGRALAEEHPELACVRLDLGGAASGEEIDRLLAFVPTAAPGEAALRDGQWLQPRLIPARPAPPPPRLPARGRSYRAASGQPGDLDRLVLRPAARIAPGPGEVEVEVCATGLNFMNVLSALGAYPGAPGGFRSLGIECAGRVARVGPGTPRFAPGDEVFGLATDCLASHALGREELLVSKPAALSFAQAAALPVAFLTASHALDDLARLEAGETVLLHSAAGGVGLVALQLARRAGARILATAGSAEKRALLRELGASEVMDSRSLDFAGEVLAATGGRGVDVVVNSLAGAALRRSLALLAPCGRFIELGKRDLHGGGNLDLGLLRRGISYFAVDLDLLTTERPALLARLLDRLLDRLAAGELTPPPMSEVPLARLADAFRTMAEGRHIGKIVLLPPAPLPPVPSRRNWQDADENHGGGDPRESMQKVSGAPPELLPPPAAEPLLTPTGEPPLTPAAELLFTPAGELLPQATAPTAGQYPLLFTPADELLLETPPGGDLSPAATYLITGGCGALGLTCAKWMLERGAGRVVLLGRHGPGPWAAERLAELERRRETGGGRVTLLQADVADEKSLAAALAEIRRSLPPLRGVLHAAGVLADGALINLEPAACRAVLAPKVRGAWNLHALTAGEPLDFFVLFSSAASLFGSPGQAVYSGANAFLDGLAHYRRQRGLPGLAINWGPVSGIGLAAAAERGGRLAAAGLASLRPEEVPPLLAAALALDVAQVAALHLPAVDDPATGVAGEFLADLGAGAGSETSAGLGGGWRANPAGGPPGGFAGDSRGGFAALTTPAERRRRLDEHLVEQVARVLRCPAAAVTPDTPWKSLGLDSLLAIQIAKRLGTSLGLPLSVTSFWTYPTVEQYGDFLAQQLGIAAPPAAEGHAPAGHSRAGDATPAIATASPSVATLPGLPPTAATATSPASATAASPTSAIATSPASATATSPASGTSPTSAIATSTSATFAANAATLTGDSVAARDGLAGAAALAAVRDLTEEAAEALLRQRLAAAGAIGGIGGAGGAANRE